MTASRLDFGPWEAATICIDERYPGNRDELADALGISKSYLSNLLAGRRRPTTQLTTRLAQVLRVPVAMIARAGVSS